MADANRGASGAFGRSAVEADSPAGETRQWRCPDCGELNGSAIYRCKSCHRRVGSDVELVELLEAPFSGLIDQPPKRPTIRDLPVWGVRLAGALWILYVILIAALEGAAHGLGYRPGDRTDLLYVLDPFVPWLLAMGYVATLLIGFPRSLLGLLASASLTWAVVAVYGEESGHFVPLAVAVALPTVLAAICFALLQRWNRAEVRHKPPASRATQGGTWPV